MIFCRPTIFITLFITGYLRLSMISSDVGKFDEASVWLSRALLVNEEEPEATLCLGDLYSRSANLEDAKRCFDKVCGAVSVGSFTFCMLWFPSCITMALFAQCFISHVFFSSFHNRIATTRARCSP